MVNRAADYAWSSRNGDKPLPDAPVAGPVPEERLLRRIAQIGGGVIFGNFEFVTEGVMRHGHCFTAGHVGAKPVTAGVYSSHGWRLARADGIAA